MNEFELLKHIAQAVEESFPNLDQAIKEWLKFKQNEQNEKKVKKVSDKAYRRKPVIIEAFQYLPDNDGNFVCPDWFKWDELKHLTQGGQTAFKGDWVVRNANGTLTVYHDAAFHEKYETLQP